MKKTDFPHTHKLIQWYPGIPGQEKIGWNYRNNLLYDNVSKKLHVNSNLIIDVVIPEEHLIDSNFWENRPLFDVYAPKNLEIELYHNTTKDTFSFRHRPTGKFFRKGDRVKFGKEIFTIETFLPSYDGLVLHNVNVIHHTNFLNTSEQIAELQIAEIIAVLADGTVIDSSMKDTTFYVVDRTGKKAGGNILGPFNEKAYSDEEQFIRFKTKEEAEHWILQNRYLFTMSDLIDIFGEEFAKKSSIALNIAKKNYENHNRGTLR